jgi:hypothetical protein
VSINSLDLFSQDIVISEYFNSDDNAKEWTELLVIKDNTILVNYTLKDSKLNNGVPDVWAGGIQFNESQLWRHLRAGTIIVIHHRGSTAIDVDNSDGYIEVGAENTTYFTKISYNGTWENDALNVEDLADVFQLINESGNHIHSLSHLENPSGVYLDVPAPKLCYPGNCSKEASLSVAPGKNIADYGGGQKLSLSSMSNNSSFITKGTPNKRTGNTDDNLNFWKQLRQPIWNNTTLTTNIKADLIELFWNVCEDSNPTDFYQGYLVVRINLLDSATAQHPKNGTTYSIGDKIGSALVIRSNTNSNTNSTSDEFVFDCNDAYLYRVYAFRYIQDNLLGNSISPSYGRGRTYNTDSYASLIIRKTKPIKPTLNNLTGSDSFCAGDSILLGVSSSGGPYEYTWYLNSVEIPGAKKNRYTTGKPGIYKVRITNEKACYNESDELVLFELPSPVSIMKIAGKTVTKDTTIVICENENIGLKISGGERYEWFKDNNILPNNTDFQLADSEGLYFAVAINNGMDCKDTSVKVYIDQLHISYIFEKDSLFFNLDKYTSYEDGNILIKNLSSDTLKFIDIIIPTGIYALYTPPPAETAKMIEPYSEKTYRVRFEPDRAGEFIDSITFILPCNNSIKRVYLFGYKEAMNVKAEPANLIFKDKITCDTINEIINFKITNYENFAVELQTPVLPTGFKISNPNFPQMINKNSFQNISIELTASQPGIYSGTAIVPFIGNGIKDKLYFDVRGKVLSASYRIEQEGKHIDSIKFNPLIGCDDSAMTTIQVINDGETDLKIDYNEISSFYLPQLPLTISKGSSVDLDILFVPEYEGQFNDILIIKSEPCGIEIPLHISGLKNGITYGLSKRNISFNNIINCKDSGKVSQSIDLIITGDSQELPKIVKITGPKQSVFSHNFKEGITLSDSTRYMIDFNPAVEGEYFDTIKIMIQPCDIEKIIHLYGKRINPIFITISDTLDFGNVEIETTSNSGFVVFNDSPVSITVDKIATLTLPFELVTQIPFEIKPDSSYEIKFRYSPMSVKRDALKITINENNPCEYSKEILLIGNGSEPQQLEVELAVHNPNSASPGQEIDIPIYLNTLEKRRLAEAVIDSFSISIEYNPTLLYPKSIVIGEALKKAGSDLKFIENPPGIFSVYGNINKTYLIDNGKLFDIKFLALLGNSMITDIKLIKNEFHSKIPLNFSIVNSQFQLVGGCNLEDRLIKYDNDFSLFLKNSLSTGLFEINIITESETYLEGYIYNSLGKQELAIINNILSKGSHQFNIDLNKLPNGIYFLKLGNSFYTKNSMFLLMK